MFQDELMTKNDNTTWISKNKAVSAFKINFISSSALTLFPAFKRLINLHRLLWAKLTKFKFHLAINPNIHYHN